MILHTFSDGGARGNPGPSAIGVVLAKPDGTIVREFAECIGNGTNNKAEYRAMIKALELAKEQQATQLLCHGDSELIIFQLQGRYRIKDAQLKMLAEKVKSLAAGFQAVTWKQVPREHSMISRADKLLNRALDGAKTYVPEKTMSQDPDQGELF